MRDSDSPIETTLSEDELLTVAEVAAILKVPLTWVYGATRGRNGNRLPHVRVGRYLRFEIEAIRAFIEERKRGYQKSRNSARMGPGWNSGSQ